MNKYKFGIRAVHQKDIKTAIIEAKQNGFEALEIHFSSPQFLPQNHTSTKLEEIKEFAQKNGIILQTHSEIGQSLIQADDFMRKAEKLKLERMVSFSKAIGARCLTLHPGNATGYLSEKGFLGNDNIYPVFYKSLFENSLKHVVSIAPKDLFICIENTDSFVLLQKILEKYLKSNKVFIAWDMMKSFTESAHPVFRKDQWKFMNKNINYVRNVHISGPKHGGIKGWKKKYLKFLKLLQDRHLPLVIEILSLREAIETRKIIQDMGF